MGEYSVQSSSSSTPNTAKPTGRSDMCSPGPQASFSYTSTRKLAEGDAHFALQCPTVPIRVEWKYTLPSSTYKKCLDHTHTTSTHYSPQYIDSRSDAGRDGAGWWKCLFVRGWVEQRRGREQGGGRGQKGKRQKGRGSLSFSTSATLHSALSFVPSLAHPPSHTAASSRVSTSSTSRITRRGYGANKMILCHRIYFILRGNVLFLCHEYLYSQLTLMLISPYY